MDGPRLAILVFFISAQIALASLDKYSELVVADPAGARQRPGTVRVTYLGVNGYHFEANGHALLVEPYFTRAGLASIAFQQRLEPNGTRISFGLRHVRWRVDAVLVTYAHFDHLLDVAEIMKRTHGQLVAGVMAANPISCGLDRSRVLSLSLVLGE